MTRRNRAAPEPTETIVNAYAAPKTSFSIAGTIDCSVAQQRHNDEERDTVRSEGDR